MTIRAMEDELTGTGHAHQDIIKGAFNRSRASLRVVLRIRQTLKDAIDRTAGMEETGDKTKAMAELLFHLAHDIQVTSRRLLVTADPLPQQFRDALAKTLDWVRRNIGTTATILDQDCTAAPIRRCRKLDEVFLTPPARESIPSPASALAAPSSRIIRIFNGTR